MAFHFDFTGLRLFVSITETNSLTKGAERTHMSLPSASNRIKRREKGWG